MLFLEQELLPRRDDRATRKNTADVGAELPFSKRELEATEERTGPLQTAECHAVKPAAEPFPVPLAPNQNDSTDTRARNPAASASPHSVD
jgi:hypothetical protein